MNTGQKAITKTVYSIPHYKCIIKMSTDTGKLYIFEINEFVMQHYSTPFPKIY